MTVYKKMEKYKERYCNKLLLEKAVFRICINHYQDFLKKIIIIASY